MSESSESRCEVIMPDSLLTSNETGKVADSIAYETRLRAMPSYELKAEYLTLLGKRWDDLPRPRLESAIQALLEHRLKGA